MKHSQLIAFGAAVTLTAGGFVATATPASAATSEVVVQADAVPTRLVRFADLDLTQAAHQAKLNRRVAIAIGEVCEGSESYASFQSDGPCRTASWARAKPQIARAIDNARMLAANGLAPSAAVAIAI
ncbi:UrcA family protein [Sphingomonas mesophila]|uniref:UrcA family protein n=1 Tax=Sphingomonas mesophila TaxID=2303576 RepID=UPI000E58CC63|nr:UrcA family protein [Sphingomonas mesophila]